MLIKDEMLRGAIARALRITEDKITKEEMKKLIRLSARSCGIVSLDPSLEVCTMNV